MKEIFLVKLFFFMVFWLRIRICPRSESTSYSLYFCHSHISGLYAAIESHSGSFSSLSFSRHVTVQ